jgi:hypothetical protein
METEDRLSLIDKRLNMIEEEIEKMQKDLNIVGELSEIKIPCNRTFENSLSKKLLKDENESRNTP